MTDAGTADTHPCHVCGAEAVVCEPAFAGLRRVTGDCRPWASGGEIGACRACGTVQKPVTSTWRREATDIYAAYALYRQGGGQEQAVFDQSSGSATPRSALVVEALLAHAPLPRRGRMLDVGCGLGAMLRSFAARIDGWALFGNELDERHRRVVESIRGVEGFHAGDAGAVPGRFDLITLNQVLEHIAEPGRLLECLRGKLGDGGVLLIDVPDFAQNPFDIVIADHCSHFTLETLGRLVAASGFDIVAAADDLVPKDLTIIARAGRGAPRVPAADGAFRLAAIVRWLEEVRGRVRELAERPDFGLFGTGPAATWLFAETGAGVRFFVDEDCSRVGRDFLGLPVRLPRQVADGSDVFLALPPAIAAKVAGRLARSGQRGVYHTPPAMTPIEAAARGPVARRAGAAPAKGESAAGSG